MIKKLVIFDHHGEVVDVREVNTGDSGTILNYVEPTAIWLGKICLMSSEEYTEYLVSREQIHFPTPEEIEAKALAIAEVEQGIRDTETARRGRDITALCPDCYIAAKCDGSVIDDCVVYEIHGTGITHETAVKIKAWREEMEAEELLQCDKPKSATKAIEEVRYEFEEARLKRASEQGSTKTSAPKSVKSLPKKHAKS